VNTASPLDVSEMLAALDWIQRLKEESATEKEVADWLAWYESDERHRQAFDELQRFWIATGQLSKDSPALAAGCDRPAHGYVLRFRSLFGRSNARAAGRWAAVAVLLVLLLVPAVMVVSDRDPKPMEQVTGSSDRHAGVRHSVLPDGSAIDLAARSTVGVKYTATERLLTLDHGEAFFSVAPNHARPFIVNTPSVRVRAVGTKFDVREEEDRVIVSVVEGIVDVSVVDPAGAAPRSPADPSQRSNLRVNAGNEVTYDTRSGESTLRTTEPDRTSTWREGRLDYIDAPLRRVVSDLNRYSYANINVPDPEVGRLTYTGTVLLRSIDEWLQAMPKEFPIEVVRKDGEVLIIRSASFDSHGD
jgi:transmembrane sensor